MVAEGRLNPASLGSSLIVDLSVTLSERHPNTWPGHMRFAHHNWNWFAEADSQTGKTRSVGPYHTNFLVVDEHCGTHFDAPTHFLPPLGSGLPWANDLGSESGDKVPLGDLMGPAAVIDVRFLAGQGEPGTSPFITDEHVKLWERQNGELRAGEVVLFWTSWDRYYVEGDERYLHGPLVTAEHPGWPALSPEAAVYLHEQGIRCVAIDAPSIGSAHDGIPVHREGLSRGLRYVEGLTGLRRLPVRGAYFVFLPVKIGGSSGGPGRAIALVSAADERSPA